MKKLFYKFGAGAATAALIGSTFAGAAFANVDVTIKNNGNGSSNRVKVSQNCKVGVSQTNLTFVGVLANVSADTGDNNANGNTGGDVTIDTGKATSSLNVDVGGSINTAEVPGCCECFSGNSTATIKGNGNNSSNRIRIKKSVRKHVRQTNVTIVGVAASVNSDTGDNTANGNTGGNIDVTTGNANSSVDVTVGSSENNL